MNKLEIWKRTRQIRAREVDTSKIKSIIESAENNAKVVLTLPLNETTSTVIYRELYESIRQLGDASLWLKGFEPLNHEVSMESLKDMNIKNKILLNHLPRYKAIRNDINYRGYKASKAQAKELTDFWNACNAEIIKIIRKEMK